MTGRRVRFALTGASGMGFQHGRLIQQSPEAELVMLHSSDEQRAKALAGRLGVAWTTDYDAMISDRAVDAVIIATEPGRHALLAVPAISQGKHLWIEKPVDESMNAAKQILDEADNHPSVIISIVSPLRFDPLLQDIKQAVSRGTIGFPVAAAVELAYSRGVDYYNQGSGWRQGAHVLLNQAIHWLDVLIWIFGYPSTVNATMHSRRPGVACADTASVFAQHPGGVYSSLSATTNCRKTLPERFAVTGTRGKRIYDQWARRLARWFVNPALVRQQTPIERQRDDVIRSIKYGLPPAVSVRDAYDALRFVKSCEAASLSSATQAVLS